MGIWRVIGSAQLHNLAARSTLVFNSTPSGNKLVGIHDRMGMKFASKFIGAVVVKSQLFKLGDVFRDSDDLFQENEGFPRMIQNLAGLHFNAAKGGAQTGRCNYSLRPFWDRCTGRVNEKKASKTLKQAIPVPPVPPMGPKR
eukprot:1156980-Pelagomonas_calceolata.AAC.13